MRSSTLLFLTLTACASTTVTTTVLPPHQLAAPVCPEAVLVHDDPNDVPRGGRLLAQLRVEGGGLGVTSDKIRHRLRVEAAKLGANHLLATDITTPSTLAALGMAVATSINTNQRDEAQAAALTDPNRTTQATAPVPTDPSFYGRGLAYAIFVPEDTLRASMDCTRTTRP